MSLVELDDIDRKILHTLQENGRITNCELAKRVGLTTTPTMERVKRMERDGIIKGYTTHINAEAVGRGLTVFCLITLKVHQFKMLEQFSNHVEALQEVLSCYHITGDTDFLLQLVVEDMKDYERFMREELSRLPGIQKIHTHIVLSNKKENSNIPVIRTYENSEI